MAEDKKKSIVKLAEVTELDDQNATSVLDIAFGKKVETPGIRFFDADTGKKKFYPARMTAKVLFQIAAIGGDNNLSLDQSNRKTYGLLYGSAFLKAFDGLDRYANASENKALIDIHVANYLVLFAARLRNKKK